MHKHCPYIYPIELLSRKWTYFVLRILQKPKTFSEIKTELRFVTNRMLSIELRILRGEGVIKQTDKIYERTTMGRELLDALEPLASWSMKHKGSSKCSPESSCYSCPGFPSTVDARDFKARSENSVIHHVENSPTEFNH